MRREVRLRLRRARWHLTVLAGMAAAAWLPLLAAAGLALTLTIAAVILAAAPVRARDRLEALADVTREPRRGGDWDIRELTK